MCSVPFLDSQFHLLATTDSCSCSKALLSLLHLQVASLPKTSFAPRSLAARVSAEARFTPLFARCPHFLRQPSGSHLRASLQGPQGRRPGGDPAAPVTFAPSAPLPPPPSAPRPPGTQKGFGDRRHRRPPTILPGAPQLLVGSGRLRRGPGSAALSSSSAVRSRDTCRGRGAGEQRQVPPGELHHPACTGPPRGPRHPSGPAPLQRALRRPGAHGTPPPSLPPHCCVHSAAQRQCDSRASLPPPTRHCAARGPTAPRPAPSYKSRRALRRQGADGTGVGPVLQIPMRTAPPGADGT